MKEKYKIPNPAKDNFYSIAFWLFGDGYKEEGKYHAEKDGTIVKIKDN